MSATGPQGASDTTRRDRRPRRAKWRLDTCCRAGGLRASDAQELPTASAGKVNFDQIDARPAALRLLLLVFLQSVSRHFVGRRHELDHRNHSPPGAQVDDLKKALDDRFRLGGKNDRLRQGDSARWLDGRLARPILHNANADHEYMVPADPAAVARRGIFNDKTFLDSGNKALAQLSLKLVRGFDDKPRVDVQPMHFKVRVHAGKRAFHSHILIEQKQTSKRAHFEHDFTTSQNFGQCRPRRGRGREA